MEKYIDLFHQELLFYMESFSCKRLNWLSSDINTKDKALVMLGYLHAVRETGKPTGDLIMLLQEAINSFNI